MAVMAVDAGAPLPERFAIKRKLGEGAYGVVWHAYDQKLDTDVAVKWLKRADGDAVRRFKNEFRVLAQLAHPNLIGLHELTVTGDQWLLSMELVDGLDFRSHVLGGTPKQALTLATTEPPSQSDVASERTGSTGGDRREHVSAGLDSDRLPHLLATLQQLTRGLRALHHAGVLHCDIKPSNVLVDRADCRVVLLDFGLANQLVDSVQSRGVHGTPAYMSPEQASGGPLDRASDWYSVGVMLFEVLCGRLPFFGSARQVMASKQRNAQPRVPAVPGVPNALMALCEGMLARDPQLRPSGEQIERALTSLIEPQVASPAVPARPATPIEVTRPDSAPPIGRDALLVRLREIATHARAAPAVVMLYGPAGIGKSTVLRELVRVLAREDTRVFEGRCYRQAVVPFKALDELIDRLSDAVLRLPVDQRPGLTPALAALERIFPVLQRLRSGGERAFHAPPSAVELRRLAAQGFRELVLTAGRAAPLAIVIDDLHWGDRDSAELLAELLRPPQPTGVLLVACHRPVAGDSLPRRVSHAARAMGATVIDVEIEPLSVHETAQLIDRSLSERGAVSAELSLALAKECGGSPFIALELARALIERHGPAASLADVERLAFDEVIRARASELPADARWMLELIAVAGRPLAEESVRRAAALGPRSWQALRALHDASLLRVVAGRKTNEQRFDTYHDRIREVVLAELGAQDKVACHRALAAELSRHRNASAEELAHHYRGAGERALAADYAERAADQAVASLAFDRAASLYLVALDRDELPEIAERELRLRRAGALACAGQGRAAADEYLACARLAAGVDQIAAEHLAADQLLRSGHIDRGLAVMERVRRAVDLEIPRSPVRAAGGLAWRRLGLRTRLSRFEPASVRANHDPHALLRIDVGWSASCGLALVHPIRAAAMHARCAQEALRAGEPTRIGRVLCGEVVYSGLGGVASAPRTARLLRRAERLAAQVDDPLLQGLVIAIRGVTAVQEGRFLAGADQCQRGIHYLDANVHQSAWETHLLEHFLAFARYYLGRIGELVDWVPARMREAEARGDLIVATDLKTHYPNLVWLLTAGPGEARRHVETAMRFWSSAGFHVQHYYAMLALANVELYVGDDRAALRGLERGWPEFRRSLMGIGQGMSIDALELRARVLLGAAAAARSRLSRRVFAERARAATLRLRWQRAPWAKALAALKQAGVLAALGDPEQSLRWLTRAVGALDALGMQLHAACARERLAALVGGTAGEAARERARAYFARERIVDVPAIVRMLAPGFAER